MVNKAIPTIGDIARQVGVSETTVSLAFQQGSRISEATRKKVLGVTRQLNYCPNLAARRLRNGKTRTIGILVNDTTNPFYALMVRAASHVAAQQGYEVFITDSQWCPEKEVAELHRLIESRVEGILACFCENAPESMALLDLHRIPYLALDTYPKGFKGAYVANDLAEAARLVADHLAEIGCVRPALFIPDGLMQNFSAFVTIRKEFTRLMREKRLPLELIQSPASGITIQSGICGLEELTKRNSKIDGVFCPNALFALGVIEAADRLGIRVGSDLAVVGIDDLDICGLSRISLTVVRQPYEKLAQLASQELIGSLLSGSPVSLRVSLQPELAIRDSTGLKRSSSGSNPSRDRKTDRG